MNSEGGLSSAAAAFLAWCRIEKGLAPQTLFAYSLDINRFKSYWAQRNQASLPVAADLGAYVDALYAAGLSSRSVARHLTTLRNFYRFLLREGRVAEDATRFLHAPKQWRNLPKYLTREQVEQLLAEPKTELPRESRDRAMIEVLYASGLRVSELCGLKLSDANLSLATCGSPARAARRGWCRWARWPRTPSRSIWTARARNCCGPVHPRIYS